MVLKVSKLLGKFGLHHSCASAASIATAVRALVEGYAVELQVHHMLADLPHML
jgi:hypothetical protein